MKERDTPLSDDAASGLLFARVLDGKGGARQIDWDAAHQWSAEGTGETLWLHLDRTVDHVERWLSEGLELPEPTVETLVSNDTAPRAFREDDTLVTIVRGVNLNPGAEPEDMVAMQIWAREGHVITLRRRTLKTPLEIRDTLDAGRGPRTTGDLVAELVEQLAAKMGNVIVNMNARIDALELLAESDDTDTGDYGDILHQTADIRRECLAIKRFMSPQHEALQAIGRNPPHWMSDANVRDIVETIERLRRYLDDLDVSKESAIVLQDDLNNRVAGHSNKTMYMLSIVAAIFLPLGFVTGLLGINVGGMPGVSDSHAFAITCALLLGLFIVQILIFRKMKWL